MSVTEYKLFDSSAWLALFYESNESVKTVTESKAILFTSVLSIFEIARKLLQWKTPESKVKDVMTFIKSRSIVIDIDNDIAEAAVKVSLTRKLGAIDALIYATAVSLHALLITGDHDFSGLPNTDVFA